MPVLPEMVPPLTMVAAVFATIPNVPPDMVPAPELVTLAALARMAASPAAMAPELIRRAVWPVMPSLPPEIAPALLTATRVEVPIPLNVPVIWPVLVLFTLAVCAEIGTAGQPGAGD